MPLQSTSGAASYDAFGGGTVAKVNYIEDFFQSYLRTGTGASATVTTGLDGSTKETLVWTKSRSAATAHKLTDNVRGATKALSSNTISAEATDSQGLTAFSATGYTLGTNTDYNNSGATYVDWQWVSQPKFFDVVTYSGNNGVQNIAHNLGSVPGCIIVKDITSANNWFVYHKDVGTNAFLLLETTNATISPGQSCWNNTAPTSTQFTVGATSNTNGTGSTYVAFLFAHNAGGFGLTGTDNVISCGSYTGNGAAGGQLINLGYEVQWVMIKNVTSGGDWWLTDVMRGFTVNGDYGGDANLSPNSSGAESQQVLGQPDARGFRPIQDNVNASGQTYIYIAIRRGPMKVPTSGTSVFSPNNNLTNTSYNVGFPNDWAIEKRPAGTTNWRAGTRLTGNDAYLDINSTAAEVANTTWVFNGPTNTFTQLRDASGALVYSFRRAPSFFDEVCYTGTGTSSQVLTHNLQAIPTLTIFKKRSASNPWDVVSGNTSYLQLNETLQAFPDTSIAATSTTITAPLGAGNGLNASGATYVAYLFATCAGVSKCFNYTGNGSSQTINCGFTGGARWILIKRTDSTGDWYVWDSARGIVSGNDPHLSLNTTAAEVTTDDTIDTDSTGFVVNQVSATNVNVSSATYIGIAIA